MNRELSVLMPVVAVIACMVLAMGLGIATNGRALRLSTNKDADVGFGPLSGAVMTLLSLLLGFSMSIAWGRFDRRLALANDEAVSLEMAVQRIQLLPAEEHDAFASSLARYIDAVLEYNRSLATGDQDAAAGHVLEMQVGILKGIDVSGNPRLSEPNARALAEALDRAFETSALRMAEAQVSMPCPVMLLLAGMSCLSAFLTGREISGRHYRVTVMGIVYILIVGATYSTIVDFTHPRSGLIRLDNVDKTLVDVRNSAFIDR